MGAISRQAAAEAGISAREAEVLALVGEHLSNAEVGARLFISVRTVETHVSSLLRKLGVPDRRALAQLAAALGRAERSGEVLALLPWPLTSFIGRERERAALAEAVTAHRQVTAVGPGGVGKTRLALVVAAEATGAFADGVWFVDLVPITDPAMVGAAVGAALGIGEQQGRGIDESVLTALADRHALLVLDNCEHLRDGVAPFVERLLAACPRLTVLATSRARLMVPFERVCVVPPLSLAGHGGASDAVALFVDRAAAVGWAVDPAQRDQAAEICRELDGIALAIELAAARLPALGLDGLAAGLTDQLRLLAGGPRAEDRHRSVRAMLDWSDALLESPEQALLRRISVFVAPFGAGAAAEVAGFAPLEPGAVVDGLARLAERSLLEVASSSTGTRYRTVETIRQYAMERLGEAGDLAATRSRHLRWCLASATDLARDVQSAAGAWRASFDAVADDLRAALGWAADRPDHRADAYHLALDAVAVAERALELARRVGDPLASSAALDALTGAQLAGGDARAAAATARRRIELLSSVPVTPASAQELADALAMATTTSAAAGDLLGARRWGRQLRDLPLLVEVGHYATSRLLVADALAGNVDDVLAGGRRFLDAWERSGRPRAPDLGIAAAAVAMVHGLRGDDARAEWLAVVDQLGVTPERRAGYGPTFDAIVLLHHGQAGQALERLAAEPGELRSWVAWMWRHWYAALRGEATVLVGDPQASGRLAAARTMVAGHPVAGAIVDRAQALLSRDGERLLAAAAALDAAGSRYQWARTLLLAGGNEAATGAAALADLGVAPMRAGTG